METAICHLGLITYFLSTEVMKPDGSHIPEMLQGSAFFQHKPGQVFITWKFSSLVISVGGV